MTQRQTDKTVNFIQENGSVTYRQMMSVLNINSPRDIIRQLKKDGTKGFYHKFYLKEN